MFRIAVVEDDAEYIERITRYIEQFALENNLDIQTTAFRDGMEIVMNYRHGWDIIFLDIEMPDLDGFSAAKEIRARDSTVLMIFITNMARYAIHGYEVEALDFILKPVSYEQFYMKMQKAVTAAKIRERKYIMLSTKDGEIRISVDEVLYVEVTNHHLQIVTLHGTHTVFDSLNRFEKQLPEGRFARCSQSYLVNLQQVRKITASTVLVDTHELPVSRTRKKSFFQAASNYLGGGMR